MRTGLGSVLLHGCQAVGEHLNAKRIPTGKRQALAAYEPRVMTGFGMTFERSPMGADHTSGTLRNGNNPCYSGLQVQGTANSPAGMVLLRIPLCYYITF